MINSLYSILEYLKMDNKLDKKKQSLPDKECKLKICFLGSSGVGKTCIVRRFNDDVFDPYTSSTIGVAFFKKYVNINGKNITLEIWDTAGQERYEALVPMYYRGAAIIVIVFDINDEKTFTRAKRWINEISNISFHVSKQTFLLLGNKSDADCDSKKNQKDKYLQYALENNIMYYECSAKTGHNVVDAMNDVISIHINNYYNEPLIQKDNEKTVLIDGLVKKSTKKCCN